jgi:hypothetical protein
VSLAHLRAHTWSIEPNKHKEILNDEPKFGKLVDYFNVCQALSIRANLISALDYVNTFLPKDAMSLLGGTEI